ncbi:ATP-binding protein [Streptomyces sp. NPDC085612]|uniref:ATP-binding protein n=1 Tax=Streptomyces sp. NPDC085612 TaxID=3365732 RepID=UPI0037D8DBCC
MTMARPSARSTVLLRRPLRRDRTALPTAVPAAVPIGPRRAPWVRRNASRSWLARNAALWARSLEPLRPLCAPAGRATDREASWPLVRDPASAGRARRLVRERLRGWGLAGDADTVDTAELLVSELVTNALRHSRGPVRLNLRALDGRLMCVVEDTSDAGPVRRTAGPAAEGGRGLELLDLLSESWGSSRTAVGKATWFSLSVPPGALCRPPA